MQLKNWAVKSMRTFQFARKQILLECVWQKDKIKYELTKQEAYELVEYNARVKNITGHRSVKDH